MSRIAEHVMTKIENHVREDGKVLARTIRKELEAEGFTPGTDADVCSLARTLGFIVHGRAIVQGAK